MSRTQAVYCTFHSIELADGRISIVVPEQQKRSENFFPFTSLKKQQNLICRLRSFLIPYTRRL